MIDTKSIAIGSLSLFVVVLIILVIYYATKTVPVQSNTPESSIIQQSCPIQECQICPIQEVQKACVQEKCPIQEVQKACVQEKCPIQEAQKACVKESCPTCPSCPAQKACVQEACIQKACVQEKCPTPETCKVCPENTSAAWTGWSDSSLCSAECGPGKKTQTRTCKNSCVGAANTQTETVSCNLGNCPINGGWTSWVLPTVSNCIYTTQESRTCTNPSPQYGGANCVGNATMDLITTPVPNCTTARWVSLTNSAISMICILGIQVFDQNGNNISDGKTGVYQSSYYDKSYFKGNITSPNILASGQRNNTIAKFNIATSGKEAPTVSLDLGSVYNISKIIVYNRLDGSANQTNINGVTINLVNSLDNGVTFKTVWTSNAIIANSKTDNNTFTVNLPNKKINAA
jgi:hypothetical protein